MNLTSIYNYLATVNGILSLIRTVNCMYVFHGEDPLYFKLVYSREVKWFKKKKI